jgi:hypothetical protein
MVRVLEREGHIMPKLSRSIPVEVALLVVSCVLAVSCAPSPSEAPESEDESSGAPSSEAPVPGSSSYDDLVTLFTEWREFERPAFVDGVPDYSVSAMSAQRRNLAQYRARLDSIDSSGWPVSERVDYEIVRAEMNGLDFDHRVRKPWARNPAFYVTIFPAESDVPAHEGPVIHGWVDLWTYDYPLAESSAAELAEKIGVIPMLLEQARSNLVEDARDLWLGGIRGMKAQSGDLADFAEEVAGTSNDLDSAIASAKEATDAFAAWLEGELSSKTGSSGVGKDNYTWYLQNVHLVPYTWEEIVTLMRGELWRSHAALKLEEHRNRNLPPLPRVSTPEEFDRRFGASVDEFVSFLVEEEIVSAREYMDPALRAKLGTFSPAEEGELRGFFGEVSYRDPVAMRTHSYHWVELARMEHEPHASPIRRVPSLYNIFDARSEGLATGMEEWMMHAGLFDENPRARELIYIMLAQRAARALGGLMMHGNEMTIEEATRFASEWTPRGWMPPDSNTVWGEQHLYLAQPGYGVSYLIGKIQIEKLLAERSRALGDGFTIKGFFDELSAAGVIPVSLLRWELTGDDSDLPWAR